MDAVAAGMTMDYRALLTKYVALMRDRDMEGITVIGPDDFTPEELAELRAIDPDMVVDELGAGMRRG